MPESSGVASTVLPMTYRSYWSVIHALEAWFGEAVTASRAAFSSSPVAGRSRRSAVGASACSASCQLGRAYGRL